MPSITTEELRTKDIGLIAENREEAKKIQELYFSLGYKWFGGSTEVHLLGSQIFFLSGDKKKSITHMPDLEILQEREYKDYIIMTWKEYLYGDTPLWKTLKGSK